MSMTETSMFDFSSFMIIVLACNKSIHLLVEKICCFLLTPQHVLSSQSTIMIIVVFIRIPCEGNRG